MMSLTKLVRLSVVPIGLAGLLAGCNGPDNEKGVMTNADGSKSTVTGTGGGISQEEYLKKAAKESEEQNSGGARKGYPKK